MILYEELVLFDLFVGSWYDYCIIRGWSLIYGRSSRSYHYRSWGGCGYDYRSYAFICLLVGMDRLL